MIKISNSIIPRLLGDDYQALNFWIRACDLFHDHTKVVKIAYEFDEIKAFDDIVLFYDPFILDEYGQEIKIDYFQVKYNVVKGKCFTFDDLMSPVFINAKSISILQRLAKAKKEKPENNYRFYLITPRDIDQDDPLRKIYSNNGGEIKDAFFKGGTKSEMGLLRNKLIKHLDLTGDDDLQSIIKSFRLIAGANIMKYTKENLNYKLISSGFKPVECTSHIHPYIALIRSLFEKKVNIFTKDCLKEICEKENLWSGDKKGKNNIQIGVRSFYRWAENMENETEKMLCLKKYFIDRYIKQPDYWKIIIKDLQDFIYSLDANLKYDLHLDVHSSIAFLAGYYFDTKSGIDVAPIQKMLGKRIWRPDLSKETDSYPSLRIEQMEDNRESKDTIVAIGITRDILKDVFSYIKKVNIKFNCILSFSINESHSNIAVKDGTHAYLIADKIISEARKRIIKEPQGKTHIFFSGPNGLMFFIGQQGKSLGKVILYEYDFDNPALGNYQPSLFFN